MKDWRDTHWTDNGTTVWITELLTSLGDDVIDLKISDIARRTTVVEQDRSAAANLDYPIIVVKSKGRCQYVLDGNHRIQQAIDKDKEMIKAKVLDLDSNQTPKKYKKVF